MANIKTGLQYFNVDTDRYQDMRIKKLKKVLGCSGLAVYDYILCEVYRVKGCFLQWDESTAFDVADYFGLKDSLVQEIVNYCGSVGLFDAGLLSRESKISSLAIQRRYIDMCTRAKRKDIKIPEECKIVPEESAKLPEQSPIVPEVSGRVKESIVEESIVEESKVEESKPIGLGQKIDSPSGDPLPKLSKEEKIALRLKNEKTFYQSLTPFLQVYDKVMVRAFYDYWREASKSGFKMKWELEKTWDLRLRLAKWQSNDDKWCNSKLIKKDNEQSTDAAAERIERQILKQQEQA